MGRGEGWDFVQSCVSQPETHPSTDRGIEGCLTTRDNRTHSRYLPLGTPAPTARSPKTLPAARRYAALGWQGSSVGTGSKGLAAAAAALGKQGRDVSRALAGAATAPLQDRYRAFAGPAKECGEASGALAGVVAGGRGVADVGVQRVAPPGATGTARSTAPISR